MERCRCALAVSVDRPFWKLRLFLAKGRNHGYSFDLVDRWLQEGKHRRGSIYTSGYISETQHALISLPSSAQLIPRVLAPRLHSNRRQQTFFTPLSSPIAEGVAHSHLSQNDRLIITGLRILGIATASLVTCLSQKRICV